MTCLKLISGAFRNPNFHREYLQKYSEPTSDIFTTCTPRSLLYLCKISRSETSQKISYSKSAKMTCLKLISGAFKNPNFHREYLQKYSEPTYEIFTTCTPISLLYLCKISRSETSQKISYSKSAKMTCLKLISGAFRNPNFHREYL
jgi:spore coat protein CotH